MINFVICSAVSPLMQANVLHQILDDQNQSVRELAGNRIRLLNVLAALFLFAGGLILKKQAVYFLWSLQILAGFLFCWSCLSSQGMNKWEILSKWTVAMLEFLFLASFLNRRLFSLCSITVGPSCAAMTAFLITGLCLPFLISGRQNLSIHRSRIACFCGLTLLLFSLELFNDRTAMGNSMNMVYQNLVLLAFLSGYFLECRISKVHTEMKILSGFDRMYLTFLSNELEAGQERNEQLHEAFEELIWLRQIETGHLSERGSRSLESVLEILHKIQSPAVSKYALLNAVASRFYSELPQSRLTFRDNGTSLSLQEEMLVSKVLFVLLKSMKKKTKERIQLKITILADRIDLYCQPDIGENDRQLIQKILQPANGSIEEKAGLLAITIWRTA